MYIVSQLGRRVAGLLRSDARWVPLTVKPTEERSFREHCAARLDRLMRVSAIISILVAVAWWPLDLIAYSRFPSTLPRPESYRLVICAICALLLFMPRTPRFRAALVPVLCVILAVGTGMMGYTGGQLGGLDQPWFHFAYPALHIAMTFPLNLRQRITTTILQAAGWLSGLLLFHPGQLASRFLPATLCMTVLVCVSAIAFGHYAFLLFRDNFLQSLALSKNAAELEDKVAAQTQALRELLTHVDRARDDERVHISRELHDELGQELTALRYALGLTRERFRHEPVAIENNLCELESLLERTTRTVRGLVGQLRPLVLEDLGLVSAARWLAQKLGERCGIPCNLTITGDDSHIEKLTAVTAFRVIQEALTNVMRHANAGRVDIELLISPQHVDLSISDDGDGFAVGSEKQGMGIRGMRERVLALGSRLHLTSSPGTGTTISCRLPRVP